MNPSWKIGTSVIIFVTFIFFNEFADGQKDGSRSEVFS
jgi:hypothetical protein